MNRCHGLLGPQNGSDLPSALGLVICCFVLSGHNLFNPGQIFLMIAPFVGWPLAQLWTMSSGFEDCVVPCGLNNVGEEEGEVRIKRLRK